MKPFCLIAHDMLSKFHIVLLAEMVVDFCFKSFIVDEKVIFIFNVLSRITSSLNSGERLQISSTEDKIFSSRNNT